MPDRPWIIVPCFNEAARLDSAAFAKAMARPDSPVFIFVDDGSTDGTLRVLEVLREAAEDRCHVLSLPKNRGKAEAVRCGLNSALAADASRVGYWDADLATPLSTIREFDAALDGRVGAEVIMGSRVRMLGRTIERSAFRHYVGRVYATLASITLRLGVYDTQCGAKLFRRTPALERALSTPFRSRWAFDVELLRRLQIEWGARGGSRIVEVPLQEWRDVGKSKVSLRAGAAAYLFLFRLMLRPGGPAAAEPAPPEEEVGPAAEFVLATEPRRRVAG